VLGNIALDAIKVLGTLYKGFVGCELRKLLCPEEHVYVLEVLLASRYSYKELEIHGSLCGRLEPSLLLQVYLHCQKSWQLFNLYWRGRRAIDK
jgi:hypothetical protein